MRTQRIHYNYGVYSGAGGAFSATTKAGTSSMPMARAAAWRRWPAGHNSRPKQYEIWPWGTAAVKMGEDFDFGGQVGDSRASDGFTGGNAGLFAWFPGIWPIAIEAIRQTPGPGGAAGFGGKYGGRWDWSLVRSGVNAGLAGRIRFLLWQPH